MEKVKVAFVGAGSIARAHLNAFASIAECSLVGVCDPNLGTLEQFVKLAPGGLPSYVGCAEMIEDAKPDAIIVSTPPSQREEALALALAHGCSVLMEKPLAHTADSARRMVEITDAAAGVFSVGFCHRFVPALGLFREWIESGKYGRLIVLHNTFGGHAPGQKDHWMSDGEISGGGVLMDVACHSLDIVHYLCGDVRRLQGVLRNIWDGRGEDSYCIIGEAGVETLVQLCGSWVFSSSEFSLRLRFEKADVVYEYGDTFRLKEHGEDWREETLPAHANVRFQRQAKAFIDGILGQSSDAATFKDALVVNEELASLYQGSSVS